MAKDQHSHPGLGQTIFHFTVPDVFRSRLWELDVESLFLPAGRSFPCYTEEFESFLADIVAFLQRLYFDILDDPAFTFVATAPGSPSTTYSTDLGAYIGLHFDNFDQTPIGQREVSRVAVGINFGDEDRYLIFINLTALQIFDLLRLASRGEDCAQHRSLLKIAYEFMSAYPDYPVARLALKPGEGYLAPTQNMIHDGYTLPKSQPDINLLIRAMYALRATPSDMATP